MTPAQAPRLRDIFRLLLNLVRYSPWHYAATLIPQALRLTLMLAPGLIARAVFDHLSAGRPLGPDLWLLIGSLVAGGTFVTAIAGRSNVLIQFWIAAFRELGRDVPYHVAEDIEGALQELGTNYAKRSVGYELVFEDSEANRMRILRFLLADYLPLLPREFLVGLFDRYACDGQIEIRTASEHYVVGK